MSVDGVSVESPVVAVVVVDISSLVDVDVTEDEKEEDEDDDVRTTPKTVFDAAATAENTTGCGWRVEKDDVANAVLNGDASGGREDVARARTVANR